MDGRYGYKEFPDGISEERPLDFHSPYGCSKGAADQYVRDYTRIYGLRAVVFRQSCIYGIRQFGVEDQGWVAHFVISPVFGRPLRIYGDGKQVRDVLYMDDLIRAFDLALRNIERTSGEIYNIGGGPNNQLSLLELIYILEELSRKKIEYSFHDWRPGDQRVFVSDISKAKRDFGWRPQIGVRKGIERLSKWVNENRGIFEESLGQELCTLYSAPPQEAFPLSSLYLGSERIPSLARAYRAEGETPQQGSTTFKDTEDREQDQEKNVLALTDRRKNV